MRRLAIVAVGVAGLGLFGSGVHGIARLDGRLADADDRQPAVREAELRPERGARGECPGHDRRPGPSPEDSRRL